VKLLKAVEKVKPDLDAIQPEKTLTGAGKGGGGGGGGGVCFFFGVTFSQESNKEVVDCGQLW